MMEPLKGSMKRLTEPLRFYIEPFLPRVSSNPCVIQLLLYLYAIIYLLQFRWEKAQLHYIFAYLYDLHVACWVFMSDAFCFPVVCDWFHDNFMRSKTNNILSIQILLQDESTDNLILCRGICLQHGWFLDRWASMWIFMSVIWTVNLKTALWLAKR